MYLLLFGPTKVGVIRRKNVDFHRRLEGGLVEFSTQLQVNRMGLYLLLEVNVHCIL